MLQGVKFSLNVDGLIQRQSRDQKLNEVMPYHSTDDEPDVDIRIRHWLPNRALKLIGFTVSFEITTFCCKLESYKIKVAAAICYSETPDGENCASPSLLFRFKSKCTMLIDHKRGRFC